MRPLIDIVRMGDRDDHDAPNFCNLIFNHVDIVCQTYHKIGDTVNPFEMISDLIDFEDGNEKLFPVFVNR